MKASGYPNGFKATIYSPVGRYPGDKQICGAVPGMLKKIGIDLTCRTQTWPLYANMRKTYRKGKRKGAVMFLRANGNGGGETELIFRTTLSCKGPWSQHCDKEVDTAFEKVTDLVREKALVKIMFRVQALHGVRKGIKFQARPDEMVYP